MTTKSSVDIPKQLIRASVQGVVYLIDSPTGNVYTYNLKNPTYIGKLEKIPEEDKHMISKTNGCLANARVIYRNDIREIMKELRANPDKKLSHVIPTSVCA
jgi:hypothetical protein